MKGMDDRSAFSIMQLGAAAPLNCVLGVLLWCKWNV